GRTAGPASRQTRVAGEVALEQLGRGQALTGALLVRVAGAVVGRRHVDVVEDQQVLLVGAERREDRAEVELALGRRRARPEVRGDVAVGRVHDQQPLGALATVGVGGAASHGVEQRQRDGSATEPAQDGTTAERTLADVRKLVHGLCSSYAAVRRYRNASVVVSAMISSLMS